MSYLEQLFSECLEKEKTAGLNAYEEMMKGISEICRIGWFDNFTLLCGRKDTAE
ncbi:MAG: hypothetical protein ACLR8P_10950 [Clostridium fessum]